MIITQATKYNMGCIAFCDFPVGNTLADPYQFKVRNVTNITTTSYCLFFLSRQSKPQELNQFTMTLDLMINWWTRKCTQSLLRPLCVSKTRTPWKASAQRWTRKSFCRHRRMSACLSSLVRSLPLYLSHSLAAWHACNWCPSGIHCVNRHGKS